MALDSGVTRLHRDKQVWPRARQKHLFLYKCCYKWPQPQPEREFSGSGARLLLLLLFRKSLLLENGEMTSAENEKSRMKNVVVITAVKLF